MLGLGWDRIVLAGIFPFGFQPLPGGLSLGRGAGRGKANVGSVAILSTNAWLLPGDLGIRYRSSRRMQDRLCSAVIDVDQIGTTILLETAASAKIAKREANAQIAPAFVIDSRPICRVWV